MPRPYVICTTFRSGSWLLCDGLAATGIAGKPHEYLEEGEMQVWGSRWDVEPVMSKNYVEAVKRQAQTENGVFGIKLLRRGLATTVPKLRNVYNHTEGPDLSFLSSILEEPTFFWLRRMDKVRQAVSWAIAVQTGVWWDIGKGIADPDEEPVYRYETVKKWYEMALEADEAWSAAFRAASFQPVVVTYEELSTKYDATIRRILCALEIPNAETLNISPPRLRKMSDERSELWVKWFNLHHFGEAAQS